MNSTLLINKLDPNECCDKKHRIFFMIGEMDNPETKNRLIDLLHNNNIVEDDELILKYNGIELLICVQQIPSTIKFLCKEGFSIYEVYHPYNPEE